MYTKTHICIQILPGQPHAHKCTNACTYLYTHTRTQIQTHILTHTHTHTHTHAEKHALDDPKAARSGSERRFPSCWVCAPLTVRSVSCSAPSSPWSAPSSQLPVHREALPVLRSQFTVKPRCSLSSPSYLFSWYVLMNTTEHPTSSCT